MKISSLLRVSRVSGDLQGISGLEVFHLHELPFSFKSLFLSESPFQAQGEGSSPGQGVAVGLGPRVVTGRAERPARACKLARGHGTAAASPGHEEMLIWPFASGDPAPPWGPSPLCCSSPAAEPGPPLAAGAAQPEDAPAPGSIAPPSWGRHPGLGDCARQAWCDTRGQAGGLLLACLQPSDLKSFGKSVKDGSKLLQS